METTKLSSKGQIIVPKSIRKTHHYLPGQEFIVIDTDKGILLKPKPVFEPTSIEDIANRPPYQGKPKTIEQMNAAISHEIKSRWLKK